MSQPYLENTMSPMIHFPSLFVGLLVAGTSVARQETAEHALAAPPAYRVITLRAGGLTGLSSFNAKDQIAFSIEDQSGTGHAYFYDGQSVRDIGSLGGIQTSVSGINAAGEVAGTSTLASGATRAFKWSRRAGMRDLGTLTGAGTSIAGFARPINNRGQVVGMSSTEGGESQAFVWSEAQGMRRLGGLPGNASGFSIAHAINDAGLVAGHGNIANGEQRAFVWTRTAGMTVLGTLGGPYSVAAGLSDAGLLVGGASNAALQNHIVVWSRREGMRDVGTAGAVESYTSERPMSANGHVAGFIRFADGSDHAALWTRATGLLDLGTLGGPVSYAAAVNNQAHVVGAADVSLDYRPGILWSANEGMIDLNTRLRDAPPGLQVFGGLAISDNGVIFATTNAGFVLLKPDCDPDHDRR
jgi:probable HAF family extracellular repeat protein